MPILARAGAAAAKGFGMLGKVAAAVDEYFKYVTLLLHGNGTNGAQNNTFLDSSTNNFTITRNGNTTQGTFSPYGSNWGNYFDGSGDYLSGIGTTSSFNFLHNSTALFTIEAWVYVTVGSSYNTIIDTNGAGSANIGCWFTVNNDNKIRVFITKGSSGNQVIDASSSTTVPLNQWVHVAVTYDQSLASNNATFYINGVASGNGTKTANAPSSSNATYALQVGAYNTPSGYFNGYISNLRINNSIVYTGAFTPSTSPLSAITGTALLTCQSNRFIDNSSNAFAITRNGDVSVQRFSPFSPTTPYAAGTIGGSGYFDGTGDFLEIASNSAFTLGSSGDFTIESWIFANGTQSTAPAMVLTTFADWNTNYTNRWGISISGTTLIWYTDNGGNGVSTTITPNTWFHVAVVRSGSTITMYLNGNSVGTQTSNQAYTTQGSVKIGFLTQAGYFNGYLSNIRVVKGTAVYTSTFTPPAAPLTAITNTQLLTNFTNGGIIDNAMMNDLETVGNAQISTSVSKFGGGSLAFDGTGDWLLAPSSPNFAFLTGDFTVEMWAYFNNTTNTVFFDMRGVGGGSLNNPCFFWSATASTVQAYLNNDYRITSGTLSTGQWYHIALVRSGTTATMYINGVSAGTYTYSTSVAQQALYVGTGYGLAGWNGYIDDLRITKGYARYTANFTAPTAPFPTQ